MKYGMRERIIGGVILVALAVILVPMFLGSPAERESASAPTMTINQQPIEVPQRDVAPPQSELSSTPEGSAAQLSQYAQLLPGAPPPSAANADAQRQAEAATSPEALQEPAEAPVEPAPVTSVQAPAPQAPAPRAQAPEPRSAPAARQPSTPSSAPSSSGSLASSDPIMAAASRHSAVTAPGTTAAAAGGNWSVQAGSFGQSANADRLIEQLRGLGFDVYRISRGANSVVMVGPFASSQAGESARQQLQQRANINGFVVRNNGSAG